MQQTGYQVRFDFGVEGLLACASDADVIVWVDALPTPAMTDDRFADLLSAAPATATLISADLPTSRVAAKWVLDYQANVNRRLAIAVIAASPVYAVDDFLADGSVIDALSDLGLDATSPEAAAAEASFRGLRNAVGHLITASVAGRAQELPAEVTRINPVAIVADVVVIRDVRS
jgi:2-phosphosulfolactate phosphatase